MKSKSENSYGKTCPKCQTKNQISNRYCKKCGFSLSVTSFRDKRAMVLAGKKRMPLKILVSFAILTMILGVLGYWQLQRKSALNPRMSNLPKVSGDVSYASQAIDMTDIEATVENGRISIPIDVVLEKKIVRFEFESKGSKFPLLAYVTPSGKAVTAMSICEPCRSTRFHIQKKTMVCNACATEWKLETLQGIRGGCLNYPPDLIPSTIENDRIWIDENVVIQWRPRV
jgi:hypothetical protein